MFMTGGFRSKISYYICPCNHNMIIINLYKIVTHDIIDSAVNSVKKESYKQASRFSFTSEGTLLNLWYILTCSPRRPVSRWTTQCPSPPPPHTPPPRVSPSHASALSRSPLPKSMDIQVSYVNKVCILPVLLLWLSPRFIINRGNM